MATVSTRTRAQFHAKAAEARKVALSPLMKNLIKVGYIGRGILFAAIGFIALQIALGKPAGSAPDQRGALETLAAQPFGEALLIIVAVGLVGFSLWGFIRALLDPLHRGSDSGGILERIGFFVSGVSYGLLVIPTVQLIMGSGSGPRNQTESTRDMTAQILAQPWGQWAVGIIGVIVLVWAISQLYAAVTLKFERDFAFREMTAREEDLAEKVGELGIAARAFVFALIGMFLIQAAIRQDPNQAKGLDSALVSLVAWPGGLYVLGFVAVGLILFGIYSALCARWLKVI